MKDETIEIPRRAFETLVRQIGRGGGSYPNPDDPEPVGPWGPVVRALLQALLRADPEPSPWRAAAGVFGPQPEPWVLAALNPQPLPPRVVLVATLTDEVIRRATFLFDLAAALPDGQRERAEAAAAAQVSVFAAEPDDGICPLWPRWPRPHPHHGEDLTAPLDGVERAVAAAQLHAAARSAAGTRLGEVFGAAARQLRESAVTPAAVSYEEATLTV
jgi:hypothetical protein